VVKVWEPTALLKKFEEDYEVYVDAQDAKSYWMVYARLPREQESLHTIHRPVRFISSRNDEGTVLVLTDPEMSENYSIENWGTMNTFEDFVRKALEKIVDYKKEAEQGKREGCGTSCG
jgi:hypothetical protein